MSRRFMRRSYAYIHACISHYRQQFSFYARRKWRTWRPRIDRVLHASMAISTATSTFKLSVEIIPIILSVLTVIATAPLLSGIMPAFVFDQSVIFFTVLTIAGIAGYQKFRELALRAKLDLQIKKNTSQGKKFKNKIQGLTIRLQKLERTLPSIQRLAANSKQQTPTYKQYINKPQIRPERNTRSQYIVNKLSRRKLA